MAHIYQSTRIEARPADVYQALTTAAGLAGWWSKDTTSDASQVGARVELPFADKTVSYHFVVEALVEDKKVAWKCVDGPEEWVGTTLMWELKSAEGGTDLSFQHKGWKEESDFYASCNAMWGHLHVGSLPSYLKTGKGDPIS